MRTLERPTIDLLCTRPASEAPGRSTGARRAEERARLGRSGRTPAFVDGQIAAVARVNDLVLVTGNLAHYRDFEGLVVEDWTRKTG